MVQEDLGGYNTHCLFTCAVPTVGDCVECVMTSSENAPVSISKIEIGYVVRNILLEVPDFFLEFGILSENARGGEKPVIGMRPVLGEQASTFILVPEK